MTLGETKTELLLFHWVNYLDLFYTSSFISWCRGIERKNQDFGATITEALATSSQYWYNY